MTETPEQAAAASAAQDKEYLYEEVYRPWFVWALILAPCLIPPVWYVPGRNVVSQRRYNQLDCSCLHCAEISILSSNFSHTLVHQ
jgi:hypothetical protein